MNKATILRISLLALALINQVLVMSGHSVLPIDEATLENFISTGFVIVMSLITTYKNTSITKEAKEADKEMKVAKAEKTIAKATGARPSQNDVNGNDI